MMSRLAIVFVALIAALFLSSCTEQSSDGHTDHQHPESPANSGEPAAFNADDVAFATNMIPHHEQAVEMSALVPDRSTNPEVIALARNISAAQEPEILAMQAFLVQWKNPGESEVHEGHGGAMQGMVDGATMKKLTSLDGTAFDTLWLQSMINHHEGAIEMAKDEVANGANVDAKSMAQTIVATQQSEIGQMKQLLEGGQ